MQDTIKTESVMAADEVAALTAQTEEQESMLENSDKLRTELQDRGRLRTMVNKNKRLLERNKELTTLSDKEKVEVERDIKKLTELIVKEMPTQREMDAKLGTQDSEKAVRHNIEFHKKHDANLLRLKQLKLRLDPHDPEAGNLERIRPK